MPSTCTAAAPATAKAGGSAFFKDTYLKEKTFFALSYFLLKIHACASGRVADDNQKSRRQQS